MDLRRIRCFLAVIDTGSVTAAARSLYIAQPALSRQLLTLERELKLTLFIRRHNRLVLTPAGAEFAQLARPLLLQADALAEAARTLSSGVVHLVLGTTPATLEGIIAPFIGSLGAGDPLVVTRVALPYELADMLRRGLDLIVSTAAPEREFAHRSLGEVPVMAYVTADHPWAERNMLDLATLATQSVVLPSPRATSRREFDLLASRVGLSFEMAGECDDADTIHALAASRRAITVGTVTAPRGVVGLPLVAIIDDAPQPVVISLHAAWEQHHYAADLLADLAGRMEHWIAQWRRGLRGAAD